MVILHLSLGIVEDVVHCFQADHVSINLQRQLLAEIRLHSVRTDTPVLVKDAVHGPNLVCVNNCIAGEVIDLHL